MLQVKLKNTNVVSEGTFSGKIVEFSFSYQEGSTPKYVTFKCTDEESSVSGSYYADSKQFAVVANGDVTASDLEIVPAIYTQCIELTQEPEEPIEE